MEKRVIRVGRTGALIARERNGAVYEYVSAWGYDPKTGSWAQGHYFTPYGDYTTEDAYNDALAHFKKHYR